MRKRIKKISRYQVFLVGDKVIAECYGNEKIKAEVVDVSDKSLLTVRGSTGVTFKVGRMSATLL